jgi:hypothetical protein
MAFVMSRTVTTTTSTGCFWRQCAPSMARPGAVGRGMRCRAVYQTEAGIPQPPPPPPPPPPPVRRLCTGRRRNTTPLTHPPARLKRIPIHAPCRRLWLCPPSPDHLFFTRSTAPTRFPLPSRQREGWHLAAQFAAAVRRLGRDGGGGRCGGLPVRLTQRRRRGRAVGVGARRRG